MQQSIPFVEDYLTEEIWSTLLSATTAFNLKMKVLVEHLARLGLRHPHEGLIQSIVGVLLCCDKTQADTPDANLCVVKDVKQHIKWETQRFGEIFPYIDSYPDIADFEGKHPELFQQVVLKSAACHALKQDAPLGLDACSVCQRLVLDGLPPSSNCTMAAGVELLTIVMRGAARNARPDADVSEPDSFYKVRKAAVRVELLLTRLRPGGQNQEHPLDRDDAHLVNIALLAWLSIFEGAKVWRPFNDWGLALSKHVLRSYSGAECGMQAEDGEPNDRSCHAACVHARLLWDKLASN